MTTISNDKSTAFDAFCQASEQDLDRVEGPITLLNTGLQFYIVRDDTEDELREYQVRDLKTCTCGKTACEHITLAIAFDTETRVAMATQALLQAKAVLLQNGIKQNDVELAEYNIQQAIHDLAVLGVKQPTIEETWNIPSWMLRHQGPLQVAENDFIDE